MSKYLLKIFIVFLLVFVARVSFATSYFSIGGDRNTSQAFGSSSIPDVGWVVVPSSGISICSVSSNVYLNSSPTDSLSMSVYSGTTDSGTSLGTSVSIPYTSSMLDATGVDVHPVTLQTVFTFSPCVTLSTGSTYSFVIKRSGFLGTSNYKIVARTGSETSHTGTVTSYFNSSSTFHSALSFGSGDYMVDFNGTFDVGVPVGNSISGTSPASGATDVDAFLQFQGNYSNDGTYTDVAVIFQDLTSSGFPTYLLMCGSAVIGTGVPFSCGTSGHLNTDYQYNAVLYHDDITVPSNSIQSGMISFATGSDYTPPVVVDNASCFPFANDVSTLYFNMDFDFGGCLSSLVVNAVTFLFLGTGSVSLTSNFSSLSASLSSHVPFSYLYDIPNVVGELYANTGSMEYAISVPFQSSTLSLISASQISAVPYASTIKTILGYLIYFFTAMTLYRIALTLFNKTNVN